MPPTEEYEEKVEAVEVTEAASGRRWKFSLAMVAAGVLAVIAAIVLAAAVDSVPTEMCLLLGIGGFAATIVFGLVAAGSDHVGVKTGKDGIDAGAHLPRAKRVRTKLRRKGFEPEGRSPADDDP